MKRPAIAERILLEEIQRAAQEGKRASKGLPIGSLIKMLRAQLGMSQNILSRKAGIPQSTLSRIEKGEKDTSLSTLNKILQALGGNLVILPLLQEPIDTTRKKQAKKQAERRIRYLKGTMNLEKQEPDPLLLHHLLKAEEDRLLQGPNFELWEED